MTDFEEWVTTNLSYLGLNKDKYGEYIDERTFAVYEAFCLKQAEVSYLQMQIDRLMLEYRPNEMTPEQMENWEKHQVKYKGIIGE